VFELVFFYVEWKFIKNKRKIFD